MNTSMSQLEKDERLFGYACDGNLAKVSKWHHLGASIHARVNLGRTAIIGAACNGHHSVVQYLIEHGANVNDHDNSGMTALMLAIIRDQEEVVKLLLDNGCDTRCRDKSGRTPMDYAADKLELMVLIAKHERMNPDLVPCEMAFSPKEMKGFRRPSRDRRFEDGICSDIDAMRN